ncbi:MAG: NAD-dependent epimerase/dehydratase family protein [Clostridium sp.]|nr:NAD-dependent epimerase/dehydratase family protein [Ruminococcus flavefaciens]MCM1499463.1 NAD-dependent epimerase/dehydratase family protein [Clostridium sp.]
MNYLVIGGAGFIGSHVVRRLIQEESESHVTVYDNFSSGQKWHLREALSSDRLHIIQGDIKNLDSLTKAMAGMDTVYSLASNPDIAKAMTQPDIDFWEGTYLINNVVEAMRRQGVRNLLYASGSGVYGDVGSTVTAEDFSPMLPSSTYGASKLACEALICSYCHMFGFNAAAFRFANVVGPNQTHGVGFDFLKKLRRNPRELEILGDGSQSKSYIYIEDIVDALRTVEKKALNGYSYYNVATLDHITVTEIADIVTRIMGLENVLYKYSGGDRGWKGDVPIVRLASEKIRHLGWANRYTSEQAIELSVRSMYTEAPAEPIC